MTLPDTSVWIDHFRAGEAALDDLLSRNEVLIHPFVLGELAMGQLKPRSTILSMLRNLPRSPVAKPEQLLAFVDGQALFGLGIGFVDAHLLLAAQQIREVVLWTRDKRLRAAAQRIGVAAPLS